MARRRLTESDLRRVDAAAALQARLDKRRPGGKKRQSRVGPAKRITTSIAEVERRLEEDDWDDITATVILQLWVWCYREIYGVEPLFTAVEWSTWSKIVGAAAKRQFGGDWDAVLFYIRWLWKREERIWKWARDTNRDLSPKMPPAMFATKLINEWRAWKAKQDG